MSEFWPWWWGGLGVGTRASQRGGALSSPVPRGLAQLGSGHLVAVATVAGIVLGNWLFTRFVARRFGLSVDACG